MTAYKQNKRLIVIALILFIGAFFIAGTTAYAAAEPETEITPLETGSPPPDIRLVVKEVWLTGDTLHISVADGGEGQIIELNLRDYAMPGDEYVTVQATDNYGRESNSITFKNPYYQSGSTPTTDSGADDKQNEPAVPNGATPFTPDGTGTVLDNVTEADGKEFFSITTEDGNVFYLIVDRQRNSENVYLLNAVTEDDLASLAKPGDGRSVSAVEPPPTPTTPPVQQPEPTPEPTPEPAPAPESNSDIGTFIFIGIAALVFGGAAYYFKIVRPKKSGEPESDYEPDDDFGEDDVVDLDSDKEDGDDE